jgi:hypothetical protein
MRAFLAPYKHGAEGRRIVLHLSFLSTDYHLSLIHSSNHEADDSSFVHIAYPAYERPSSADRDLR